MCRSIFHRNTIYRSVIIEVRFRHIKKISFSLPFLCASRQTVSASAVNLLHQKRKKRTLAETLISAKTKNSNFSRSNSNFSILTPTFSRDGNYESCFKNPSENSAWLSSIAYLQKQLHIFIFYAMFYTVITHVFLLNEAIMYVLACILRHYHHLPF